MSYSSITKDDLAHKTDNERCCQIAELSAIVRNSGTLKLRGNNNITAVLSTENAAIARKIYSALKKSFHIQTELVMKRNRSLKKSTTYDMVVEDALELLKSLRIIEEKEGVIAILQTVPETLVKKACCKRAYLRGVFMAAGSISDPEKSYHVEIVTHHEQYAESLKKMINKYGLSAKIIERKNSYVVYLKEGDQIVDMLNIIGAHNALLGFENTRIIKQMRNSVNRIVNCETANLSKTIDAAGRQLDLIEYMQDTVGLTYLPDNLRVIAEARLEYPEMSLMELAKTFDPPLGKSGINHRLRKIETIALELKEKEGRHA
jgi:hypothetical protein